METISIFPPSLLCAIARSTVSHLPRTVSYPDSKNYPKNACAYFIYSNSNGRLILISNKMIHNFLAIFRAFSAAERIFFDSFNHRRGDDEFVYFSLSTTKQLDREIPAQHSTVVQVVSYYYHEVTV